ncbi:MAG TPA: hypothetical protein PKC18_08815 [Lacipirellulaceae bacterium]|nr:hypothetical protein [Lacipirellulaceae bacterium]
MFPATASNAAQRAFALEADGFRHAVIDALEAEIAERPEAVRRRLLHAEMHHRAGRVDEAFLEVQHGIVITPFPAALAAQLSPLAVAVRQVRCEEEGRWPATNDNGKGPGLMPRPANRPTWSQLNCFAAPAWSTSRMPAKCTDCC